jgi:flagellar biosynthesis protein FlhB
MPEVQVKLRHLNLVYGFLIGFKSRQLDETRRILNLTFFLSLYFFLFLANQNSKIIKRKKIPINLTLNK